MCKLGKRRYSRISLRLEERDVANQGDPFKLSLAIAVPIEVTAIEGAVHAVVSDPARHNERMQRSSGQKTQHFRLVLIIEPLSLLVAV